jgi:hypothetical protein
MSEIVTDKDVQGALDFMRQNAFVAAKVRSERLYLEEFRKSKKALLMKKAAAQHNGPGELSIGAQEREAYADPEMLELLDGYRVAVENDERARFSLLSAQAIIDAWRSQQANQRAMGKIV